MVGRLEEQNRAQLILVGCLALAFVIVSVGLLVNSTLYTESASPSLANAQVENTEVFDYEVRSGVRELIHRINHGERVREVDDLGENVTASVTNYSALLAESYGANEPAAVGVNYSAADSTNGTRVIQAADGEWEEPSVASNDYLTDAQTLGWFTVNVNVTETSEDATVDPFTITVADDTGTNIDFTMYQNTTGTGTNLTITSTADGTTYENETCDPIYDRVLVDLDAGSIISDGCTGDDAVLDANSLGTLDRIQVQNGDEFYGKWEFVTNTSVTDDLVRGPECWDSGATADSACRSAAVWTANVTTTYDSASVSFEHERNVTIYGEDP